MKNPRDVEAPSRIIDTPSLADEVRARLLEDIMERRFVAGQKLPVQEIAARYGVSETPVKQAFNRLVSEGMLVALPRRGVEVRRVSIVDIRELMEARHMVNLVSVDAAIACLRSECREIGDLLETNLEAHRRFLRDHGDSLTIESFLQYVRIDRQYHTLYLQCARNRTIERFFDQLHNQAYAFVSLSALMLERIHAAYDQHFEIYTAASHGDRDEMIEALHRHKDGAIDTVEKMFDEQKL